MSFNRPSAPTDRPSAKRDAPQIWAEGRQQPRFDLRGFARVGLLLSRQMARPVLLVTTRFCSDAAESMAENTIGPRLARASTLGRALPRRESVARGFTATGALLALAADLAVPPPPAPAAEPQAAAPPLLIARRPRQAERLAELRPTERQADPVPPPPTPPATRPAGLADFDAPTLAAIRALIDDMRVPEPVTPQRPAPPPPPQPPSGRVLLTQGVPLTPPEPKPPTLVERLAGQARRCAAGLIAGTVTLVVLPVGLVKAVLLHLNGNDLRDWS